MALKVYVVNKRSIVGLSQRHLREIDCSLTVLGWAATTYSHGGEFGGKSIQWPCIQHQSIFIVVGNISTTVNKCRLAGWVNEWFISIDVYGISQFPSSDILNGPRRFLGVHLQMEETF